MRIIGLANLGEWLTASLDWVQPPADNAAYQWERCDSNGEACSNLDDVAETHVVETDDVGKTIRVKATVSNSLGTTILTSPAVPILDSVQSQAVLFRPYLRFDFAEHWRPLNVPQFLIEIFEDGSGHLLCFDANSQCLQSPPVTNLGPPYHWLDIKGTTGQSSTFYTPDQLCFKQVGGQDCDKGSRSAIYYEPTRDPVLGYLYLDYWFFYRYNEEPIFPDRDHEGDWEGMTVVVDPTGPPNNTGGPVAAYVLYAIHDDNTWSAYLGAPGTTHTTGYVGQGTHATYPGPCAPEYGDYCGPFEASYDGAFPWSRNDDAECSRDCAIRFEDSDGGAWASWDGTSGINTAPGWGGDSPLSPGQQKRFTCAKAGYQLPNCPTPPFAGIPAFRAEQSRPLGVRPSAGPRTAPPIGGPAGAAMVCAAWEGTSSAVTICQPDLLRKAIRNGNISLRIRPNLRIARFRGRITAAPGVTQAIGQPLQAGQTATIRGPLQNDTDLVVRMRDKKRRWVALFKLPRLSKDRTAALTVRHGDQHPIVSIRWPNRQLAAKYFGRDK